ncbi:MAG: DUF1553 domain-containing protein [Planctomycetota bacterium]|nr:DUF1553 domain-containing protein [Planctomycetota bacterium]
MLTKQETQFFETRIRPILASKCYGCHSVESGEAEGGLRLDSREAMIRGGSGGPAIQPKEPAKSLIIKAIEYHDPNLAMPPKSAGGKLEASEIKDLTRWVRMGAPDPRKEQEHLIAKEEINESAKQWWAYQPLLKPTVPAEDSWSWTTIDRFVAEKHRESKLQPVSDAKPESLLRRLHFDLTGLPPSIDQVRAFGDDLQRGISRQEAIENVVDQLLDSDAFAVQWGRHWLDVARYAESSGRDVNIPYNQAWRYRDWVIDAFAKNKPFDQFLVEQIAGDLIPTESQQEQAHAIIATGFLAIGSRNINEGNTKLFALDQADEQIDSVFQATMATTMACARCHDHKFEPISQKQYTAVAGIFLSSDTRFGASGGNNGRNGSDPIELPSESDLPSLPTPWGESEIGKKRQELSKLRSQIASIVDEIEEKRKAAKANGSFDRSRQQELRKLSQQANELEFQLSALNDDDTVRPLAMGVVDRQTQAPQADSNREKINRYVGAPRRTAFPVIDNSPFFARGDVGMPGEKVQRSVPDLFGDAKQYQVPTNASGRLQLAKWIASPSNPLTARVAVNRFWHWMMGQGLVDSVDNFGTTGSRPSHPELLDYLAGEFISEGWDVKKLVRKIALSRAYQLSSIEPNPSAFATDPENKLLWRAKGRRLQAEEIRDAMLSLSDRLDAQPILGTAMAKKNIGNRVDPSSAKRRGKGEVFPEDICRSIYLPMPRGALPEVLELFDLPDAMVVQGARESTNVPSQSLYLLNSPIVAGHAGAVARSVLDTVPGRGAENFEKRLELLYEIILCRKPTGDELSIADELYRSSDSSEVGWVSLARGLLATAEFRYLD